MRGELDGDTEDLINKVDPSDNVGFINALHLPFANHVHRLVTGQSASGRVEGKEAQTRPSAAFDEAVVLFD